LWAKEKLEGKRQERTWSQAKAVANIQVWNKKGEITLKRNDNVKRFSPWAWASTALVLLILSSLASGDARRITIFHDEARLEAPLSGQWDEQGRAWLTVPREIRSESLIVDEENHPQATARLHVSKNGSSLPQSLYGQLVRLNPRSDLYDPAVPALNEGRIVSIAPLLIQRSADVQYVDLEELSFDASFADNESNLEIQGGTPGEPLSGQLRYAFEGLSWQASYSVFFDPSLELATLVLRGLVKNESTASFSDVLVDLIAGQPQRVTPRAFPQPGHLRTMALAEADLAESGPTMKQNTALLYHQFSWPHVLDIRPGDEWLLPVRTLSDLPAALHYRSEHWLDVYGGGRGSQQLAPLSGVLKIEMQPSTTSAEPIVFPAGQAFVHLVGADSDTLLGEDRVEPIREPEALELEIGAAFDVQMRRQQMDFRRLTDRVVEIEMSIEIVNQSDRSASIEVVERIPGDWRLLNVSPGGDKLDGQSLRFLVTLEPQEKSVLSYRVNVRL